MKRVIIIGSPGSGKSVFSHKLENITKLPVYHLDMIYHNKDGTHIPKDEFDKKLQEILNSDKWIIDGNYQRTMEMRLKKCDTVFLLDFPTEICVSGAESRVGKKREDLPWIEEKLDQDFRQRILEFSKQKLPEIYELLEKYKDGKSIIIFKSREETDKYIKEYTNKELEK